MPSKSNNKHRKISSINTLDHRKDASSLASPDKKSANPNVPDSDIQNWNVARPVESQKNGNPVADTNHPATNHPDRKSGESTESVPQMAALGNWDWPILLLAAWICARTLWFCEPLGQSCDYLWGLLGLFGTGLWFLTVPARKLAVRLSALDVLAALFFLVYIASDLISMGVGNQRAVLNSLWSGLFWVNAYGLTRLVAATPQRIRILVSSVVLSTVVMSAWGLYQNYYDYPLEREKYLTNPDQALIESGVWFEKGSANRKLFEDRLMAQEPSASFALSNTLGAFLVPGLLLLGAACVLNPGVGIGRSRIAAGGFALLAALTILLTGSRSAVLAVAAVAGLAGVIYGGTFLHTRKRLWAPAVLLAVVGLAGAAAFLVRHPHVLDSALLSMEYRFQYWDATVNMIADYPLTGIGAGNFQELYTQYMSQESGESVSDPHNFLLEIAVLTGIPGALIFWCFLGILGWNVCRVSGTTPPCAVSGSSQESNITLTAIAAVFLGLLAGYAIGVIVVGRNPGPILVLMLSAVVGGWLLKNAFVSIPASPLALFASVFGLLSALLASGGIAFTTTAILFWTFCALIQNAIENREPLQLPLSKLSPDSVLFPADSCADQYSLYVPRLFAILPFLALILCYVTGYYPTTEAATYMRRAWYTDSNNSALRLQYLETAVQRDPLDCWTHSAVAAFCLQQWRELTQLAERQQQAQRQANGTTESSPTESVASDPELERQQAFLWDKYVQESRLARERNPQNSILWREYGLGFWERYQKTLDEADCEEASNAFSKANRLFPTDLVAMARLALAMAAQTTSRDSFQKIQSCARDVIKTSDATVHHNRKIPESLKQELQQLIEIDINRDLKTERQAPQKAQDQKTPE